jgi:hypothetical protein
VKILTAILAASLAMYAFMLGGCAKKNDTPEAVKQGVIRDLASKFDMSKMDVIVDSVSFRDKEADATVTFAMKGGTAADGMSMKYVMEKHDDGQWYIKSRASADAAGTPAVGAPGEGAPGEGATSASGSQTSLPPGHPALGQ